VIRLWPVLLLSLLACQLRLAELSHLQREWRAWDAAAIRSYEYAYAAGTPFTPGQAVHYQITVRDGRVVATKVLPDSSLGRKGPAQPMLGFHPTIDQWFAWMRRGYVQFPSAVSATYDGTHHVPTDIVRAAT
jgi:hypothetical protein